MYTFNDFDMPFKNIRHWIVNLISMNIFFTIKDYSFFFVKRELRTNKLLK